MFEDLKLSHKVFISPVLAMVGLSVVFVILLNGQARTKEIRDSLRSETGMNVGVAAAGSSEIARNVSGVATAARSTSDGASTTLAAATQLETTAGELTGALSQFTFNPPKER